MYLSIIKSIISSIVFDFSTQFSGGTCFNAEMCAFFLHVSSSYCRGSSKRKKKNGATTKALTPPPHPRAQWSHFFSKKLLFLIGPVFNPPVLVVQPLKKLFAASLMGKERFQELSSNWTSEQIFVHNLTDRFFGSYMRI